MCLCLSGKLKAGWYLSSAIEARIEEPVVGQVVLGSFVGVRHLRIFCGSSECMKKMGRLEFSQDPAQRD